MPKEGYAFVSMIVINKEGEMEQFMKQYPDERRRKIHEGFKTLVPKTQKKKIRECPSLLSPSETIEGETVEKTLKNRRKEKDRLKVTDQVNAKVVGMKARDFVVGLISSIMKNGKVSKAKATGIAKDYLKIARKTEGRILG